MKFDVSQLRYMTKEDFRVLTAVEMGMRNHAVVPTTLIATIAGLRGGGVNKVLGNLLRMRLIYHDAKQYDGYHLTYGGYDYLALRTLLQRGVISGVGRQIGVGKESDIFLVTNAEGRVMALKLHRLGRTSFRAIRTKRDYMQGRRNANWLYMSRLAALKEFAFMTALHDAGFPTPEPYSVNRHAVVMSLVIGKNLSQVRTLEDPATLFQDLMGIMLRLGSCGLVHCDFNEFNLLISEPKKVITDGEEGEGEEQEPGGKLPGLPLPPTHSRPVREPAATDAATAAATAAPAPPRRLAITVIDFPQMVSVSHPNAAELFERDVRSLVLYFSRRFGYDAPRYPTFESLGPVTTALDVAVEASGFSKAQEAELAAMMSEEAALEAEVGADGEGDEEDEEERRESGAAAAAAEAAMDAIDASKEAFHGVGAEALEEDAPEPEGAPGSAAAATAGGGAGSADQEGDDAAEEEEEEEEEDDSDEDGDDDDEHEEEDGSDGGTSARAAALAAAEEALSRDRVPDGVRTRPGGGRIRRPRGEAYLRANGGDGTGGGAGAGGGAGGGRAGDLIPGTAVSRSAVREKVVRGMEKAQRRAELGNAAHTKAKVKGAMKDKEKMEARRLTKGGGEIVW